MFKLTNIMTQCKIPVAVNQVECSLYFQQKKLRDNMAKMGIKLMAYGSLGSSGKDKSPKVPFHRKNSIIQLFWKVWIFVPIQQEAKHDQKKYQLNINEKCVDKAQQCFAFFTHQAKIQICSRVKLIPWNVVNLSQL